MFQGDEDSRQTEVNDSAPFIKGEICDQSIGSSTCVGDDDIEVPESLNGAIAECGDLGFAGHIA